MDMILDKKLVSSDWLDIWNIAYGPHYKVTAKRFDGTFEEFEDVRGYVKSQSVDAEGRIAFTMEAKNRFNEMVIRYPFYYLNKTDLGNTLCSFKNYKNEINNSFGMSYSLFALEWDSCIIAHYDGGSITIYLLNRKDWQERGRIGHNNRELQVFLDHDEIDVRFDNIAILHGGIQNWLSDCLDKKK